MNEGRPERGEGVQRVTALEKKPKKCAKLDQNAPPPHAKKSGFLSGTRAVFVYINDRPDGMMGIEKAAKLRKMVKKQENIEQIAEGIQRAKMLERFMD